jgi:DNA mismatch repair protein MutS
VIQSAKQKLHELENHSHVAPEKSKTPVKQTDLFLPVENEVIKLLKGINPDQLSPREALEWLYKLKQL